ncbi:substrate-binding periplasmic protein [Nitrospira sp. BLG_1]|uniref:substrate-binding periplasmic protein n=1 Tax=Nitrospira sp. BLG_1 TaxID=3395883 RepID=UPI0039BC9D3E
MGIAQTQPDQKPLLERVGVGPLLTLSSLVTAISAVFVATYHFDAGDLLKQLSESRTAYEDDLTEMQNNIEARIPERVRSPLPIFPKNEISLLFRPSNGGKKEMDQELEWVDRDRKHRHKYLVQVVCIAEIQEVDRSKRTTENFREQSRCSPHKLDADTPDKRKLDSKTFYLTQPGVDSVKVPIEHSGTYAWRVARADTDSKGNITIFEEWSPYFIFTVFESILSRVKVMNEVLVGVVEGSVLELAIDGGRVDNNLAKTEESLVNSIQDNYFKEFLTHKEEQKNQQKRYLQYPTYETLIEGVARGEVDYAIGQITRTKYREQRGVFFTRGYTDALSIFISKSGRTGPPGDGDTVGVISGSVNERALRYLAKSKRFKIVSELLLQDLVKDLQKGNVNFIFTADERAKDLIAPETNEQKQYMPGGTLYSDLRDFYASELGYSPMYAVATVNSLMCTELDKHVKGEGLPYNDVQQEIKTIYREEREDLFDFSLYLRLVKKFFPSTELPCVNS